MSIVTARNGDQLLLYRAGDTALEDYPDLPLIFACVVACYQGDVLFVFNPWRQEWELPAGFIEPGETPQQAAIRELAEESEQIVSALTYAGIALVRLSDGQLEPGALYTCELEKIRPFQANDEATGIMLWDLKRDVDGRVNEISVKLAELVTPQQ